jgi:hypothetical protein
MVFRKLYLKLHPAEQKDLSDWAKRQGQNESLTKHLAREKIAWYVEHRLRDEYVLENPNPDI